MDPRRLYKLTNRIQRYAWGRFGQDSLIHRLLGSSDTGTLAAELWIGAHPSASSEVSGPEGSRSLAELIAEDPAAWLGERVARKHGPALPFLFKVLSIRTALSIQAHPDTGLAEELHRRDPAHYPDANHKPEMAVAVTDVELLYGFRDLAGIRHYFSAYPSLARLLTDDLRRRLLTEPGYASDQELLRDLCVCVFHAPDDRLRASLGEVGDAIRASAKRTPEERWFLDLADHYPGDIGLLCLFLLSFVTMKPGEALFVGPNTPHAYLRGDLIECMANSDNVVRAGLTNKFKDTETLLRMLHFRPAVFERLNTKPSPRGGSAVCYSAPAREFLVELLTASAEETWTLDSDSAALVFCFEGKGKLAAGEDKLGLVTGESAFIAPRPGPVSLTSNSGVFYYVQVP